MRRIASWERFTRTSLAAGLLLLPGCWPRLPSFDPGEDIDSGLFSDAGGTFTPDCQSLTDLMTGDSIATADAMLADTSDGTVRVPLSPQGCITMERTIAGGRLQTAIIRRVVGFELVGYQPQDTYAILARWDRDASGVLHGNVDADDEDDAVDDDFFEIQDASDEANGTLERTWLDPSSREIRERLTITRQADGTHVQRRERVVDGALTVVDEAPLTGLAQSDIVPMGDGCMLRECTAEETNRLGRLTREAFQQSFDCLTQSGQDRGNARAQGMMEMLMRWRASHQWTCASHCEFVGQIDLDALVDEGRMSVGIDLSRSDADVASTIAHEWTHGFVGGHDSYLTGDGALIDRATRDPESARYRDAVDPMYACQAFCFGGRRDRCTCARCYGVRTCHPLCASMPSCVTRDDTIPSIVLTNEAVGASCDPQHWYPNMSACRSSGCSTCRSWSLSCDPSCQ